MIKRISLALLASLFPAFAFACNPTVMLDNVGTFNAKSALDAGSNCFGFMGLVDGTGTALFPNVAALANASATPTTARIGALMTGYNGTTWDFLTTVGTGILKSDTSTIAGTAAATGHGVSGAGVQRVELPTDGTGVVGLNAGVASIGTVGLNAGSAIIGKFGIDQTTPGTTNAVQEVPGTSGGLATCYLAATASTNSTNCKNSAGQVYLQRAFNTTSIVYYLRMYNLTTAPTCSSATGYIESIPIPASTATGGWVIPQPTGQSYPTGIGFCITGGSASTDNTNAAAGVFLTILYK